MSDERVTIFVDGSNLYHCTRSSFNRTDVDFSKMAKFLCESRKLVRTYYYNAPVRREDGEDRYQKQQKFFAMLGRVPYLELRLGRLEKRDGVVVEKGVDVQIATDMLLQAHSGAYDTAILVSGDADYCPAVRAVKTIGKHVEVAFLSVGSSHQLRQEADRVISLDAILPQCWVRV